MSTTRLSEQEKADLKAAIILESQGKLSPEQHEALNALRADPDMKETFKTILKEPEKPGFLRRLGESTGLTAIPALFEATKQEMMTPSGPLKNPGEALAVVLARGMASGIEQGAQESARILGEEPGMGGQVRSAGTMLSSVAGGKEIAEDIRARNISGALGGAAGTALTLGAGRLARGARTLGRKVFPITIDSRKAAALLGEEISKPGVSLHGLGAELRKELPAVTAQAGADKGAIVQQFGQLQVMPVEGRNAMKQLIAELSALKAESPTLFSKVEGRRGLQDLLSIAQEYGGMEGKLGKMASAHQFPLAEIDALRSRLDTVKRQLKADVPISESAIQKLEVALTNDVSASLPDDVAKRYIETSNRFANLKRIEESKAFYDVLDKEQSTEIIGRALVNQPADVVEKLKDVFKNRPDIVEKSKRAILEEFVAKGKLDDLTKATVQDIFGKDSDKVFKFAEQIREGGGTQLSSVIGTIHVGLGRGTGFFFNTPTGKTIRLNTSQVLKILGDPEGARALIKGARTPLTDKQAAAIGAALLSIIQTKKGLTKKDDQ